MWLCSSRPTNEKEAYTRHFLSSSFVLSLSLSVSLHVYLLFRIITVWQAREAPHSEREIVRLPGYIDREPTREQSLSDQQPDSEIWNSRLNCALNFAMICGWTPLCFMQYVKCETVDEHHCASCYMSNVRCYNAWRYIVFCLVLSCLVVDCTFYHSWWYFSSCLVPNAILPCAMLPCGRLYILLFLVTLFILPCCKCYFALCYVALW